MVKEAAEATKDADQARALQKEGKTEEAIHMFEMALAKYPKHVDFTKSSEDVEKELNELLSVCFT